MITFQKIASPLQIQFPLNLQKVKDNDEIKH